MNWPKIARLAALLMFVVVASASWAQSDQQPASDQPSLGEIARQKSKAKAKKVVTNDEIPPSPEADKPVGTPASSSGAAAAGAAAGPAGAPGAATDKDAAAKPGAQKETLSKIDQLKKENESLEKIIKQLQARIAETNDEDRKRNFGDVIKHAQENMAANDAEIAKLKAAGAAAGAPKAPPPALPR